MTIRILLADDSPDFMSGLRLLIERNRDMIVVAETTSGIEAVKQADALHPDVALLDVRMPGLNGIEAARHISLRCAVIMVSAAVDRPYVVEAAKAGASGFLSKTTGENELLSAIRIASRGGSCFLPLHGKHASYKSSSMA